MYEEYYTWGSVDIDSILPLPKFPVDAYIVFRFTTTFGWRYGCTNYHRRFLCEKCDSSRCNLIRPLINLEFNGVVLEVGNYYYFDWIPNSNSFTPVV